MKRLLTVLLLAGLALAPSYAAANPAAQGAALSGQQKFEKMDSNKDGKVTWEEFKAVYPQMQRHAFDSIDTNKDAVIVLDEWLTFMGQHTQGMKQGGNAGPAGGAGMPGAMPGKGEAHPGSERLLITPPSK